MNDRNSELRTITIERQFACAPDRIWAALTTPELLERWWVSGDIAPVVGHHFTLKMPKWGDIPCQVLHVDAPSLLVYAFGDWRLTWKLEPKADGTLLTLEHAGFDLTNPQHHFAFENMGPGWRDVVLVRLSSLAEGLPKSAGVAA